MARSKLFSSTSSPSDPEQEEHRVEGESSILVETQTPTPETVVEGNLVQVEVPAPAVVPTYDKTYLDSGANLSQKIRYLSSRGLTTSQIVKVLKYNAHGGPLIYQHVRNILLQKVKKSA